MKRAERCRRKCCKVGCILKVIYGGKVWEVDISIRVTRERCVIRERRVE